MKENSCCFTGHRRLGREEMARAVSAVDKKVVELSERGITHYYAGGALGFDLVASVAVLNRKISIPSLTLTVAIPFRGHDERWSELDRAVFKRVLERADEVVYVSDLYTKGCMQKRNEYMVDRSSICLCWLTEKKGGTANTVAYAKRKGIPIINLADGQISLF